MARTSRVFGTAPCVWSRVIGLLFPDGSAADLGDKVLHAPPAVVMPPPIGGSNAAVLTDALDAWFSTIPSVVPDTVPVYFSAQEFAGMPCRDAPVFARGLAMAVAHKARSASAVLPVVSGLASMSAPHVMQWAVSTLQRNDRRLVVVLDHAVPVVFTRPVLDALRLTQGRVATFVLRREDGNGTVAKEQLA